MHLESAFSPFLERHRLSSFITSGGPMHITCWLYLYGQNNGLERCWPMHFPHFDK